GETGGLLGAELGRLLVGGLAGRLRPVGRRILHTLILLVRGGVRIELGGALRHDPMVASAAARKILRWTTFPSRFIGRSAEAGGYRLTTVGCARRLSS